MHDLVGRHPQFLIPDHHVLDADAVAGDARLRAARPLDDLDVLANDVGHRLAPFDVCKCGCRDLSIARDPPRDKRLSGFYVWASQRSVETSERGACSRSLECATVGA